MVLSRTRNEESLNNPQMFDSSFVKNVQSLMFSWREYTQHPSFTHESCILSLLRAAFSLLITTIYKNTNTEFEAVSQTLPSNVWRNRYSSFIYTCLASPLSLFSSQLITHHRKRHELQDVPTTSLLQAIDTLLQKALHKLRVRPGRLGAQDGGNE